MPLKRSPTWATTELHDWLAAHQNDPFQWGTNDCCIMPANAIQAFTDADLAVDFRGKYSDRAAAFALIKYVTGGTTVSDAAAYCAKKFELVEYAKPRFAKRGDLVVAKVASDDDTEVAGLVHLNGQVVSVGSEGFIRLPISAVVRAWKV